MPGASTGSGPHSIARVCRLPGGRTDRQESDESRQVRHQAPHCGGPPRPAPRRHHLRGQRARLEAARSGYRCHPAAAPAGQTPGTTAQAPREAARRQGLRLFSLPPVAAQALVASTASSTATNTSPISGDTVDRLRAGRAACGALRDPLFMHRSPCLLLLLLLLPPRASERAGTLPRAHASRSTPCQPCMPIPLAS
jgi:hypothetical protein